MAKRSPSKPPQRAPAPRAKGAKPFALNPRFTQQTRKMLGKHYRAKYGVK